MMFPLPDESIRTNNHVRIQYTFRDFRGETMALYRMYKDTGLYITAVKQYDEEYCKRIYKEWGMSCVILNCIHPDMDQHMLAKNILEILEDNKL